MRKSLFVTLLALCLIAIAAPGWAKVEATPQDATMIGPGIDEPIDLDGNAARSLLEKTNGYEALYGAYISSDPAPAGELGPRYTISYQVGVLDHAAPNKTETTTFTQYMYPFAEGGPMLFVPEGQKLPIDGAPEMTSGWASISDFAMEHLRFYGLPKRADVFPAASTATGAATQASTIPYMWILLGALVLGAGLLSHRRLWTPHRREAAIS